MLMLMLLVRKIYLLALLTFKKSNNYLYETSKQEIDTQENREQFLSASVLKKVNDL